MQRPRDGGQILQIELNFTQSLVIPMDSNTNLERLVLLTRFTAHYAVPMVKKCQSLHKGLML